MTINLVDGMATDEACSVMADDADVVAVVVKLVHFVRLMVMLVEWGDASYVPVWWTLECVEEHV